MKKRILSLAVVMALLLSVFSLTAAAIEAAKVESHVAGARIMVIHPLDENKPNTKTETVKFELVAPNGEAHDATQFKVTEVSFLSWSDEDSVNFGEFVAGQQYLVTVEIEAVNFGSLPHYFSSAPAAESCSVNGVAATAVKLIESNKVLVVSATLTAGKVEDVLDFGQMAPGTTAAEQQSRFTNLGEIEYGTYTMFGFDAYPLTQAQKDLGYTIKEEVHVNQGGGTVATRSSGSPFDLMTYVDQVSNPFAHDWEVWFELHLYQNDVYVTSYGHIYHAKVVPAIVSYVSLHAPQPSVGTAPDSDLGNLSVGGEGYEITDIDWTDTEGIKLPDQSLFEAGKTYACVLQVETMDGYEFPADKADFSGKINGIDGEISEVYSKNKAYVTVYYILTKYGDVNADGAVDAKDALLVLQSAVDKVTLTQEQMLAAEVDGQEGINAKDALEILKYAVQKITVFPIEK